MDLRFCGDEEEIQVGKSQLSDLLIQNSVRSGARWSFGAYRQSCNSRLFGAGPGHVSNSIPQQKISPLLQPLSVLSIGIVMAADQPPEVFGVVGVDEVA